MRNPSTFRSLSAALLLALPGVTQQTATVPEVAADLPGNAAISMPLRWSQGIVQVTVGRPMLPNAVLQGQSIRAVTLRRPAFFEEPPYPAAAPTLKVSAAFTMRPPVNMRADLALNRPAGLVVVAGPAVMQVAATPAHGAGDAVAADLIRISFNPPLPVGAGHLFLEFEAIDSNLTVRPLHWVDAVDTGPNDTGLGFEVGNGGCGTAAVPMQLMCAASSATPRFGGTTDFTLNRAPAEALGWVLVGLSPQSRTLQFGFGGELTPLGAPGCHQWTAIDVDLPRTTDLAGTLDFGLPFPAGNWSAGQRVGVQVVVTDAGAAANPAGLAISNGVMLVMDRVGVGSDCCTVMAPGTLTTAPWPPYLGLLPVLTLEY